ncbi:DUF6471 domain-containing protein [Devosia sp.]|uniref:DUF6471 domain-containing protein n=1 Tax=Devosia sp. TaxID=1871048 RepID=UPI00387E9434
MWAIIAGPRAEFPPPRSDDSNLPGSPADRSSRPRSNARGWVDCTGGFGGGDKGDWCSILAVVDADANIRNKLSWGKFTAAFLLQCLASTETTDQRL